MARTARTTLNQTFVNAAKPKAKPYVVGDAACSGLRLWVGTTGNKRYQIRGKDFPKAIILDCAKVTLADARMVATGEALQQPTPATAMTTLDRLIDRYEAVKGASWAKRTDAPYRCRLFCAPILDRTAKALTKPFIEDRQEAMLATTHCYGTTYKGSSVESYRKCTASFCLWLVEEGVLPRSPFRRLRRIPIDSTIRCLSEADMTKLKFTCWNYGTSVVMAARVMLAVCAGMRRGEIGLIEKSDINLTKREIRLRASTTKSKKSRSFHLTKELHAFLARSLPSLPDQKPLFIRSEDFHFKKLLAYAELDQSISFHGLRHSWATAALRRKANLTAVQSQLGHANLKTTSIYVHALAEDSKALAALWDQPLVAVG